VVLFADDHVPVPPLTTWEPSKTYTYQRTVFIPVYPYVGRARWSWASILDGQG
jgi:hypothetical protein